MTKKYPDRSNIAHRETGASRIRKDHLASLVEEEVRAVLPRLFSDFFSRIIHHLLDDDVQLFRAQDRPAKRESPTVSRQSTARPIEGIQLENDSITRGEQPWVSVKELAPMLGLKYQTAKNLIHQGKFPIPTYKLGRIRVADRAVADAYFRKQRERGMQLLDENRSPSFSEEAKRQRRMQRNRRRSTLV